MLGRPALEDWAGGILGLQKVCGAGGLDVGGPEDGFPEKLHYEQDVEGMTVELAVVEDYQTCNPTNVMSWPIRMMSNELEPVDCRVGTANWCF